jgi:hypothetical protein
MDCLTVTREELAEQYLQGKLDPPRQDEFETHLLECAKCMQELELLQAVRQDLAERAHEIRGWTASKPFFRWQTAVLAAVLLMALAVGINQLREFKRGNESAEIPPKKQKDEPRPLVEKAPKSETPLESQAQVPARQAVQGTQSAKKGASGATAKDMQQEPVAVAEAPTADQSKGAMPTRSLPDSESSNPLVVSQASTDGTNPRMNPGVARPTPTLTTAQGVELARIAMVEPPAFTFSGIVPKGKLPRDDKRGSFSKGK